MSSYNNINSTHVNNGNRTDSVLDALWVEKYRPRTIEEVALPPLLEQNVHKWLEQRQIPHLLFYGPAGSGKTTTALIIAKELADEEDRLIINGSYYRGINDVREQILPFVRQNPISTRSSLRIVLIDEADSITGDAWKALRHIIEQFSKYSRFIMTCNYVTKIPEPIMSRMQSFEFKEFDKEQCINIVESILIVENVQYTTEQIRIIVDTLYPDLRKIINTTQSLVVHNEDGSKTLDVTRLRDVIPAEDKIVSLIRDFYSGAIDGSTLIKEIRYVVESKWLDYSGLYPAIFEAIPELFLQDRVLCNNYAYKHVNCISEDMNFMSFIYELVMLRSRYTTTPVNGNNAHNSRLVQYVQQRR